MEKTITDLQSQNIVTSLTRLKNSPNPTNVYDRQNLNPITAKISNKWRSVKKHDILICRLRPTL